MPYRKLLKTLHSQPGRFSEGPAFRGRRARRGAPIRVALFGCTGSIGTNTIDVVSRNPDRLKIVALAAGRSERELLARARALGIDAKDLAIAARSEHVPSGPGALRELARRGDYDVCVNAVVGAAGLEVTLGALEAGRDIALANKESLVMAGELVMRRAAEAGLSVVPIDSEHSSLRACLRGRRSDEIRRVFLTASGGPFRGRPVGSFDDVTVEEALNHPTWKMGPKITIDSATLMNKGLEIIEARWLFDIPESKIAVVTHPQSIIHAMAEHEDGTLVAELAPADMRIPIQRSLIPDGAFASPLDLLALPPLTFEAPDRKAFPCLDLARRALERGGTSPCVLNAANEIAVHAFLEKRIRFGAIPAIIRDTLEAYAPRPARSEEDVYGADRWARLFAAGLLDGARAEAGRG